MKNLISTEEIKEEGKSVGASPEDKKNTFMDSMNEKFKKTVIKKVHDKMER